MHNIGTDQKLIAVGGTSGIGKAIAKLVVQQGGTAVSFGRERNKLEAALADLRNYGPAIGEQIDITQGIEQQQLIEQINSSHSDAALLVNATGTFLPKAFFRAR